MATRTMGEVQFFAKVETPERWLTIFTFVAHKLWERVCQTFGEVPAESHVIVLLHEKAETEFVKLKGLPPIILIGLPDLVWMAVNEIEGESSSDRLLRAFRVIVAEELVHMRDFLAGTPIEDTSNDEGKPIKHYLRESEYRALKFAVEATGQRYDIFARVEQARLMRE